MLIRTFLALALCVSAQDIAPKTITPNEKIEILNLKNKALEAMIQKQIADKAADDAILQYNSRVADIQNAHKDATGYQLNKNLDWVKK